MFSGNKIALQLASAGLAALFIHGGVANATSITFDRLPSSMDTGGVFQNVNDSGYTVEATGSWFWISTGDSCLPACADNGTQYLTTQIGPEPIAVYKNDAGLFDLVSFDYGETHIGNRSAASYINVTGFVQDGTVVTETVFLDFVNDAAGPLVDFQTAVLPDTFRNLTMVHFATDEHFKVFSLDNIVVNDLDAEMLIPTQCEQDFPEISVTTTGGGQSSAVNAQIQVAFSGHIMTQAGLTSGGKNTVSICPGTVVNYEILVDQSMASCTLNGAPLNLSGRLATGHVMICNNKGTGSDTDRFSIRNGR